MTEGMARERSDYLFEGRRVLVSDLIAAELLSVGATLEFRRPRTGETYTAEVASDGKLKLPDGKGFTTPSRAAASAVGGGTFDGWTAWRVKDSDLLLDALRQQLLDDAATRLPPISVEGVSTGGGLLHTFLKEARARAAADDPVRLSVRDFIANWGAKGRGEVISGRINADLENHGLTSLPNFLKVGLDTVIALALVSPGDETERFDTVSTESIVDETAATNDEVGLTLGNLASGGVISVNPSATLDEAITLMLLNDFSQVPVMQGPNDRSNRYAVTWQSIGRARHANPDALLSDTFIPVDIFPLETELIDILQIIREKDFVLVKDATQKISGIVTTADVVSAYGDFATPFFIVGELDRLLRRVVAENISLNQVNTICSPVGAAHKKSYDELGFGDYQTILGNPGNWATLGWPIDRKSFGSRLEEIREIRNDIMHFNPDPLLEGTVGMVRNMIRLIRRFGQIP